MIKKAGRPAIAKLTETVQHEKAVNPANQASRSKVDRKRIPMSTGKLKLAVPEIPGYHLHWMNGNPGRIQDALAAGYQFVNNDEVEAVNSGIANNTEENGSTDLGSRVSVSANDIGSDGQPSRMYLMKLPIEYWEEDQQQIEDRNEQVARTIRNDHSDDPTRYIPKGKNNVSSTKRGEDLFYPKR